MKLSHALLLFLCLVATALLLLWIRFDGPISDLGLNGFTEVSGILITVVIVNKMLERRDEIRFLPQRAAAYDDVRDLIASIVEFWERPIKGCIPRFSPASPRDLFDEEVFSRLDRSLDCRSADVADYLEHFLSKTESSAANLIDIHRGNLDPDAYRQLHSISRMRTDSHWFSMRYTGDYNSDFPRPDVLQYFWRRPNNYCSVIKRLLIWIEVEKATLSKLGLRDVVGIQFSGWHKSNNPLYFVSREELEEQERQIAAWQSKQDEDSSSMYYCRFNPTTLLVDETKRIV